MTQDEHSVSMASLEGWARPSLAAGRLPESGCARGWLRLPAHCAPTAFGRRHWPTDFLWVLRPMLAALFGVLNGWRGFDAFFLQQ